MSALVGGFGAGDEDGDEFVAFGGGGGDGCCIAHLFAGEDFQPDERLTEFLE